MQRYHEEQSARSKGARLLGGRFGPEKKIFSPPPPQNSQVHRRHPPGPSAPSPPANPPLLGFSIKNRSPPAWRLGLPLPPPRGEKKKIYIYIYISISLRNVHQVCHSWKKLRFKRDAGRESDFPRASGISLDLCESPVPLSRQPLFETSDFCEPSNPCFFEEN